MSIANIALAALALMSPIGPIAKTQITQTQNNAQVTKSGITLSEQSGDTGLAQKSIPQLNLGDIASDIFYSGNGSPLYQGPDPDSPPYRPNPGMSGYPEADLVGVLSSVPHLLLGPNIACWCPTSLFQLYGARPGDFDSGWDSICRLTPGSGNYPYVKGADSGQHATRLNRTGCRPPDQNQAYRVHHPPLPSLDPVELAEMGVEPEVCYVDAREHRGSESTLHNPNPITGINSGGAWWLNQICENRAKGRPAPRQEPLPGLEPAQITITLEENIRKIIDTRGNITEFPISEELARNRVNSNPEGVFGIPEVYEVPPNIFIYDKNPNFQFPSTSGQLSDLAISNQEAAFYVVNLVDSYSECAVGGLCPMIGYGTATYGVTQQFIVSAGSLSSFLSSKLGALSFATGSFFVPIPIYFPIDYNGVIGIHQEIET